MEYKIQKKRLQNVVNEYDPENLIAEGAPEDEYDAYTNEIFSLFNAHNLTEDSLQAVFPAASKSIDYEMFLADATDALKISE